MHWITLSLSLIHIFGDPEKLETGINGIQRSSIYYCDPMRSGQKGTIEQAHTCLLYTSHKGTFYNAKNFCVHRYHCKKTNACGKSIIVSLPINIAMMPALQTVSTVNY